MSTGCPSPTPFGLGLGPAEPRRTNLAWETLGFWRERFSLSFSLLMPGFALRPRSTAPYGAASPLGRTLPYHVRITVAIRTSAASVPSLSPVGSSAQLHSTSPMLLVVSRMAASKPTSWLFVQSHFLFHLARFGDLSRRSGLFPFRP